MKKLLNLDRALVLIHKAIEKFQLNLNKINILTEAASGSFVVTPIIAAMAGAEHVYACTRDSRYGSADEVIDYTKTLASAFNVKDKITISDAPPHSFAEHSQLITNLNFVRPINEKLLHKLPRDAAISLMWETWEFRKGDVDLELCRKLKIPVFGTNESDKRLQIFKYIGLIALKLLLERDIEIFSSNIVVIGSGRFGENCVQTLKNNGAIVSYIKSKELLSLTTSAKLSFLSEIDAIVIVEHHNSSCLIGGQTGIPIQRLKDKKTEIIHICGNIDFNEITKSKISIHPNRKVPFGVMNVTTDYVGPKPVIDLHTAGLKVGEILVRSKRKFIDIQIAEKVALEDNLVMGWGSNQ